MARLIDADALMNYLRDYKWEFAMGSDFSKALEMIDAQPTAYDVEKVISDVEEYANSNICWEDVGCPYRDNPTVHCENCGALGALEIVRKGGAE